MNDDPNLPIGTDSSKGEFTYGGRPLRVWTGDDLPELREALQAPDQLAHMPPRLVVVWMADVDRRLAHLESAFLAGGGTAVTTTHNEKTS